MKRASQLLRGDIDWGEPIESPNSTGGWSGGSTTDNTTITTDTAPVYTKPTVYCASDLT